MDNLTIRQLYIRVCQDSGFGLDMYRAAAMVGRVAGIHPMQVWCAMPDLQTMEQIAAGTHPAAKDIKLAGSKEA